MLYIENIFFRRIRRKDIFIGKICFSLQLWWKRCPLTCCIWHWYSDTQTTWNLKIHRIIVNAKCCCFNLLLLQGTKTFGGIHFEVIGLRNGCLKLMAVFKHLNFKNIKISMEYTAIFLDLFKIVLKKHVPLNATAEKLLTIKWFEKSPFLWFSIFYSGKNICFLCFFHHILYFFSQN